MKQTLDRMFRTNLFSKIQKAYEKGFFYLPDEQGTYNWESQFGGIEGLNQYPWMLIYIPKMHQALAEFNLHFFVMAYRDDSRAVLLISSDQKDIDMKELKSRIVCTVTNSAQTKFGQKIKYFDSYSSGLP